MKDLKRNENVVDQSVQEATKAEINSWTDKEKEDAKSDYDVAANALTD